MLGRIGRKTLGFPTWRCPYCERDFMLAKELRDHLGEGRCPKKEK